MAGVTCVYIVHPAGLYRRVREASVYVFGAGTFIGENWDKEKKRGNASICELKKSALDTLKYNKHDSSEGISE